jgi:hypothetical protein
MDHLLAKKCHHISEQDVTDPQNLPSYSEKDFLDMMNFAQVIVNLSKRRFCQHRHHC